jgi:hypothetical protein
MNALPVTVLASDAEDGKERAHHSHHFAVFVGAGVRDEDHTESGFAGGLDYEYRLTPWLGVGLLAEVGTGDLRNVVLAAPIAVHLWRGLRFVAAPGAEISWDGDGEFAIRRGVGYQFPIAYFTIGPEFNADLVDGEPTYIVGLSFGVGF